MGDFGVHIPSFLHKKDQGQTHSQNPESLCSRRFEVPPIWKLIGLLKRLDDLQRLGGSELQKNFLLLPAKNTVIDTSRKMYI